MASFGFVAGNDYKCCGIDTSDEPVSEKVKRLEKELADLKAKQAAEAKPKTPTAGEDLVARLYQFAYSSGWKRNVWGKRDYNLQSFDYEAFAAAIDKAIADAKAEQREADADRVLARNNSAFSRHDYYGSEFVRDHLCDLACSIRNSK